MSLTRLARRRAFQCMHRYAIESWDEDQNRREFGACFTPTGHGHNYELETFFEGPIDRQTGMIVNLANVDELIQSVLHPIDGKHLNFEVDAFKDQVPTTETIAHYLSHQLIENMDLKGVRLVKLRLYECEDLWVDVWP